MKLPGISYGGVQSLGRENINMPARVTEARNRAMSIAFEGISKPLIELSQEYVDRQNREELQRNSEDMAKLRAKTATDMEGKTYYAPEEIPEGVEVKRTQQSFDEDYNTIEVPRAKIPGYEIKAALFRHTMRERAKQLAYGFTNQDLASKWLHQQNMQIEEAYESLSVEMVAEQKKTIQIGRVEAKDQALEERNYELAREIVSSMETTDEVKQQYYNAIDNQTETDIYDSAIAGEAGDYEFARNELETSLAFVTSGDEDYYSSGGTLSPEQRRTYAIALRGALNKLDAAENESNRRNTELLRATIAEQTLQLSQGYAADPKTVAHLIDAAMANPDDNLQAEGMKLSLQYEAYDMIADMYPAAPSVAIARLQEGYAVHSKAGHVQDAAKYRMALDMAKNMQQLEEDNSIAFQEQWGGLARTTLTRGNMADIAPFRTGLYEAGTTRHLMKPEERARIVHSVVKAPIKERMSIARQIVKGFGDYADVAMEELGQAGLSGPILVAGTMLADGQVAEAEYIMRGLELHEADKGAFLKGQEEEVDDFITKAIGNAMMADTSKKQAFESGIRLTYQALSSMMGGQPGVYEKKYLEQAAEMVLNNRVHEWNGTKVDLPSWMSGTDWDNYWHDIPHDYFNLKYKPYKYDGTQMLKDIDSGDVRPVNIGKGEYYLFNMKENPPRAIYRKPALGETGPHPLIWKPERDDMAMMPGTPPPPIPQPQHRNRPRPSAGRRSTNRQINIKRNRNVTPQF